jgi:hypothetical protein
MRSSQNRFHIWDWVPGKRLFLRRKTNRETQMAREILFQLHLYPQFSCLEHALNTPEINRTGRSLIDFYFHLLAAFQLVPVQKSSDFYAFDSSHTLRQLLQDFLQGAEEIERWGKIAQNHGPYDHEVEFTDVFKRGEKKLTHKNIISIAPETISKEVLSQLRRTDSDIDEKTPFKKFREDPRILEQLATYLASRFQFLFDFDHEPNFTSEQLAPLIMKRLKYDVGRILLKIHRGKSTAQVRQVMIRPKGREEVRFWLYSRRTTLNVSAYENWVPLALSYLPPDFITGKLAQNAPLGFVHLEDLDGWTHQIRISHGLPASELKVQKARVRIWHPSGLVLF